MLDDRQYMRRRPSSRRRSSGARRPRSVVTTLILINAGVYLLQMMTPRTLVIGNVSVQSDLVSIWGALFPQAVIENFQVWRVLSYQFLHGSLGHIFMNMWGLYLFGQQVENRIGSSRFLNMYLMSGGLGGLFWLIANRGSPIPCVGASGSVFGVVMAAAMLYPNQMIMLIIPPIPMKLKTFAMVFGGIEVLMLFNASQTGVAHLAHLGGALGGYLYILKHGRPLWTPFDWLFRFSRRSKWKLKKRGVDPGGWTVTGGRHSHDAPPTPDAPPLDDGPSAEEVDRILDKIGSRGLDSLTDRERKTLQAAREKLRRRE